MGWGFVWLMVILKIPIAMLLYLVWWAVRQVPEEAAPDDRDDDGGQPPHRPRPHRPRPARRGPHGSSPPPAPQRVRARARPSRAPAGR